MASIFKAVINKERCTGCGACVSYCSVRAIGLFTGSDNRKKAVINKNTCTGCGACIPACRFGCIVPD